MFKQSDRVRQVQDPVIPIVANLARDNEGTISLGQGVVHYRPPREVFDAISGHASDPLLDRYGPVLGQATLLEKLQDKLARENGIETKRAGCSVVCTAGANMGFFNAILAITNPGDEVILLTPFYFNHEMAITLAGCKTIAVSTDDQLQPDLNAIRHAITSRTRAIVTVSPNNPTGVTYDESVLREINQLCAEKGLFHVSDEAYEYFVYDDATHFSPGSIEGAGQHTISIYSLSKSYALAGWRFGYMVVPDQLLDGYCKIQDTDLICPPQVCQVAASAALDVGRAWCLEQIAGLPQVRDVALDCLTDLGDRCRVAMPRGAFYLFLNLRTDRTDMDLVEQLIVRYRVAVLPGSAFGAEGCTLRVSYGALDRESVTEGVGRLRDGLTKLL
ncbi:pyridoxal phosphate-dependent aminotransferase [Rhodopirellula sp. MGV]|uniref:pyridoxal phosphate-dependent aminotransferase n=1 Tax=Rhodopirellula sp. MGV TaxID=2023130 RepID=UPI000B96DC03|nr:pyridoxal phosphate-dependent aminotransferase [Rhodopirellula sp. MGV]OYP36685.1 aspartate aminotransferase [Rhodopirellula sp. MGV]PNY38221.1 aspartate aminotransferase [Rhodopirellula baltica]